jgi:hypothetical protein
MTLTEMAEVFAAENISSNTPSATGHAVAQLVVAPRYKPEVRGFDSRFRHWNFSLTQTSDRTMALGLTQPLAEMSTRNISWR